MPFIVTFQENIPLKNFCTFGIGGPARYFFEAQKIEEMQQAIIWCKKNEVPYLVIGKGSNCLFDDKGYHGAVILNKIEFLEQPSQGIFHAGAGYSFALLGAQTARKGWSGLEFASGIPASVGGAVYMNAGANGTETCQSLASVDFVNEDGDLKHIPITDLHFSYRHSPFQTRKGAIVGATFVLTPQPDARKRQIEIVNKRKQTQPYGSRSAGCVFLNPKNAALNHKTMQNLELNPCCLHAGALIDKCGLKGLTVGGAQVSQVHANFLINTGDATCQDMLALIALVKKRVKEATGIELHSEVRYLSYQKEQL